MVAHVPAMEPTITEFDVLGETGIIAEVAVSPDEDQIGIDSLIEDTGTCPSESNPPQGMYANAEPIEPPWNSERGGHEC